MTTHHALLLPRPENFQSSITGHTCINPMPAIGSGQKINWRFYLNEKLVK